MRASRTTRAGNRTGLGEELFGHPWSEHPLRWHETDLARSRIEADAWRVMNALGKAASAALDFFESHGLDRQALGRALVGLGVRRGGVRARKFGRLWRARFSSRWNSQVAP